MRTVDLMVGDYVNVIKWDYEELKKPFLKPLSLEDLAKIELGSLDVEPVYLTDEILHNVLSNGCVEFDPYRWRLGTNKNGIDVCFWDWTIKVKDWEKKGVWTYVCDCQYLHQLQHMVKLFDLDILYYGGLLSVNHN